MITPSFLILCMFDFSACFGGWVKHSQVLIDSSSTRIMRKIFCKERNYSFYSFILSHDMTDFRIYSLFDSMWIEGVEIGCSFMLQLSLFGLVAMFRMFKIIMWLLHNCARIWHSVSKFWIPSVRSYVLIENWREETKKLWRFSWTLVKKRHKAKKVHFLWFWIETDKTKIKFRDFNCSCFIKKV